jgi:DNA (cytosine-5)-methyltransferase 1
VIGGPPCQCFSSLAHLVRANGHEPKFGNLIPEFERVVEESECGWFVMEQVPQAPVPAVGGYAVHSFVLNNAWIAGDDGFGQEQDRTRRFSFGLRGGNPVNLMRWITPAALLLPDAPKATVTSGTGFPGSGPYRQKAVTAMHDHPDNVTAWGRERKRSMFGDGRPTRREHRHQAVTSSDGAGKVKQQRYTLEDACRLQGLPEDFLADAPFTKEGKMKAVANGVPLPMGRAIARAVKEATTTARERERAGEGNARDGG